MTITDSLTTADQMSSVTDQTIPAGRQNKKTPTHQIDRSPRIDAIESVERFFRFAHWVLEVNRHVAWTWTGPAGVPFRVTREQAESPGQFLPEQRPTVAEYPTNRARKAQQVVGEHVAPATPTRTGDQDPDAGVTTPGDDDQRTTREQPNPGLIDGLIGHLLDLDIARSLSTNHPG